MAQADAFISETAKGYETVVAERGMSLSGGQKQRLSIARAIVKNAEILIFDDSTSALDLKTEARFYQALRTLKSEVMKIIIVQRIATVRMAQRIVVMDHGKSVESGSHETLLAPKGKYHELYMIQYAGFTT